MSLWDKGVTLDVSGDARLGVPLLRVDDAPTSVPRVPQPISTRDSDVVWAINRLRQEVVGLRKDLASRTLSGRLRRLWAWITGLFDA